jgi:hypothetical protein
VLPAASRLHACLQAARRHSLAAGAEVPKL